MRPLIRGTLYRGTKYRKHFMWFFGFPWFLLYSLWFLGVLIIPEWLILTPRHIAILFGTFLELPNMWQKLDQMATFVPLLLCRNTCKNRRKSGDIFKTYYFYISGLPTFCQFLKRHRKMMKIRLIKTPKSWIWNRYLSKSMNGILLIWYKYPLQNIKWHFWISDIFIILGSIFCEPRGHQHKIAIFLGPKQSSFHRVFMKNGILQWWNLGNFANLEIRKHKTIWNPTLANISKSW